MSSHYKFIQASETITTKKYYAEIEEMQKKLLVMCPGMVNKKTPILLHNNARPHVVHETLERLNELKFETLLHPL